MLVMTEPTREQLLESIKELQRRHTAALTVLKDWQVAIHTIMCADLNGAHDEICASLTEELLEINS